MADPTKLGLIKEEQLDPDISLGGGTQVAIIKDVKGDTVQGGTFTSGAWQTRDLNTVEGDPFIISLVGNKFTIPAGKYIIKARCPSYGVVRNQCRIFDTTNTTTQLGSNALSGTSGDANSNSFLVAHMTLTGDTLLEIQHKCQTTGIGNGFGNAVSLGVAEIYTEVEITKIG